jgi:hypothetical protein
MPSARHRILPWAVPLLFVALIGCADSGPKIVKVTGTLKYKGQPVTNAYITFEPEFGRQSWAQTDGQGRFKINYDKHQDGAVVGKHKVWVQQRATTSAERDAEMQGKALPVSRDMAAFFQKYNAENSKYTVEITTSTKDLTLDLD